VAQEAADLQDPLALLDPQVPLVPPDPPERALQEQQARLVLLEPQVPQERV
jgi:hypothetical protein